MLRPYKGITDAPTKMAPTQSGPGCISFFVLTEPASTSLVRFYFNYFSRCMSCHLAAILRGFSRIA
jgi:hypothetical protein